MKKKAQKKTSKMWDLLIPLLLIICVMPLLVHLAVYSCGYSQYDWYSTNDILTDFYCYYKSYFLDIVAVFALIILVFSFGLYRDRIKPLKWFYPLFIYAGFVILSTIFSKNRAASIQGNFESFESCLVLIAYLILALYAYQMMEEEQDYLIIWYGILVITGIFGIIGLFQVFHCDLMNLTWVQKLLMSAEDYETYGGEIGDTFSGNNVYLSLYNPNYAGIVLSMLFAIVFVMFLTEVKMRQKIIYGAASALLLVLTWYTYSRASLLTLILTIVLAGIFLRPSRQGRKIWYIPVGIIVLGLILIAFDAAGGGKYLSRMIDVNDREPLSSMVTSPEGIRICYDDVDYLIWMEEQQIWCRNETTGEEIRAAEGEVLSLPMEEGAKAVCLQEEQPEFMIYLAETTLTFIQEDGNYYYQNFPGKVSTMTEVASVDFHELEYLGSARGYIWSRTLPLLKDYLLIGSGPDTFAESFPQEDYAGKIVYADDPNTIIEKAHNDYLTKWVQTGGISVICIILFYIIFTVTGSKTYYKGRLASTRMRLGFGCYLACISYIIASLFNDSTVQTSPFFWIFAGVALSTL